MIDRFKKIAVLSVVFAIALGASAVSAQSSAGDSELRSTIRAAILSDSRSQGMSPAELEAMVTALESQARANGMTADDIVWRPTGEGTVGTADQQSECTNFLCSINKAFGFDGSDYTIPMWLGICSLMLIFLIAAILEYRHLHPKHPVVEDNPPAPPVQ